jgi:hypothetical protein
MINCLGLIYDLKLVLALGSWVLGLVLAQKVVTLLHYFSYFS